MSAGCAAHSRLDDHHDVAKNRFDQLTAGGSHINAAHHARAFRTSRAWACYRLGASMRFIPSNSASYRRMVSLFEEASGVHAPLVTAKSPTNDGPYLFVGTSAVHTLAPTGIVSDLTSIGPGIGSLSRFRRMSGALVRTAPAAARIRPPQADHCRDAVKCPAVDRRVGNRRVRTPHSMLPPRGDCGE